MNLPFLSVVMPIRNEAPYIRQAVDRVLRQDYPLDRLEVLIMDGMSDDGTREILSEMCREHPQLRMLDNPEQIVATAMNRGVENARGEIIVRIDGHAEVATDFLSQAVKLLDEHPEAWCVGGPFVHVGLNPIGKAAAIAMSHPLGIGAAKHRQASFEGYGEGAYMPAVRRWVYDRIGNYDDTLVRTEDDEFDYRVALAGGKVFISPRVHYEYFTRTSWKKLFQQFFQYSFWRIPVIRKHKRPTTIRQIIPPLFFLVMIGLLIVGAAVRNWWLAFGLPAGYAAALIAIGASYLPKFGWKVSLLVPLAFATIHVSYAWGWVYGVWSLMFNRNGWQAHRQRPTLSR